MPPKKLDLIYNYEPIKENTIQLPQGNLPDRKTADRPNYHKREIGT